jgi:hypothetical protein
MRNGSIAGPPPGSRAAVFFRYSPFCSGVRDGSSLAVLPSSMPAKLRTVSPAPAPTAPAAPPPAESLLTERGPEQASPEPFWPRLARASMLLVLAASLHVWALHSPRPQQPVYSLLAARVISSVLVAPPVPLAPPLQILMPRSPSAARVMVQTLLLKVPAPRTSPVQARPAAFAPALVAVGTKGDLSRMAALEPRATATMGLTPSLSPTITDSPGPAHHVADYRPAPKPAAAFPPPTHEPRPEPVAAPERIAASAGGATIDRREATPRSPIEEQRQQKEVVLGVVREYARALERLDVRATKAIYPTVDGRELQRAFQGLKEQQYQIASCGVSISTSGVDANARCRGNATFRPRVGSRIVKLTDYEWVISLARGGGGWQILEARLQ